MRGSVRYGRKGWQLDVDCNLGSLISNEAILDALVAFLEKAPGSGRGGRLLDLGAGTKPYEPLYRAYFSDCTSVDVPFSQHDIDVDVLAPAHDLPFEDGSFDVVLSTEMLEHCPDPRAVMREVARVLRPGGLAFVTTPFLLGVHEQPHDYFRYTPFALELLARQAGLAVRSIEPRGSIVSVWLGLTQWPLTRSMSFLARRTRLPLTSRRNPLLFTLVYLPQRAYIALDRRVRRRPGLRSGRAWKALAQAPNGYISIFERPATDG